MNTRLIRAAVLACVFASTAAWAVPVPGQGTWETTLQSRDINGDGVVDAFYDTVLDITWLADANAGAGSSHDDGFNTTDGDMTWGSAVAWAGSLNVYGVTGWRLPVMNTGSTAASELSHMYCVTLGDFGPCNPLTTTGPGTWGFTNTGDFRQLESQWYWTGTAGDPGTAFVWAGDPISAYHSQEPISSGNRAWAVRDGDVPVVPEPETYALMLLGLGALGWVARSRAPLAATS
jgi:hypothetical protein